MISFFATISALRAYDDKQPDLLLTIIGDSTVSAYATGSTIRGWGEFVQPRLRRRVRVTNLAVPGASTVSFIAEGRWKQAMDTKPQVILIQFGTNDSLLGFSLAQYRVNLRWMVESSRAAGAFPILVTPMQLRVFQKGQFVPSLRDYAGTMRQVATETGTLLVDLHDLSGQLYTKLGPERTQQLGPSDATHFNATGAHAMADIILRELTAVRNPLLREIVDTPTAVEGTPKPVRPPAKPPRRTSVRSVRNLTRISHQGV